MTEQLTEAFYLVINMSIGELKQLQLKIKEEITLKEKRAEIANRLNRPKK